MNKNDNIVIIGAGNVSRATTQTARVMLVESRESPFSAEPTAYVPLLKYQLDPISELPLSGKEARRARRAKERKNQRFGQRKR